MYSLQHRLTNGQFTGLLLDITKKTLKLFNTEFVIFPFALLLIKITNMHVHVKFFTQGSTFT